MKYGLVVCDITDNLGDDILSYAAYKFLPKVDYIIDRENTDTFVPESKEYVKAIFNGWFLHDKFNWPPSEYIYPLFIGIHFSPNKRWGIEDEYLNGIGKEYLEKYIPIGCRDTDTLYKLKKRNIDAYFSGCLTLTLCPFENVKKTKKIILVDLPKIVRNYIIEKIGTENVEIVTHAMDIREKDWSKRKEVVEHILKKYQSAKSVITTRLHCALPCLALGTKVLLVCKHDKDYDIRISAYEKYLNICTEKELLEGIVDIDNIKENNIDFMILAERIRNKCTSFINDCLNSSIDNLPDVDMFLRYWRRKTEWQRLLIKNEKREDIVETAAARRWLEEQYNSLNLELENYKQSAEEQKKYIQELIKGKEYLELHSAEQDMYIEELQKGKKWLQEHIQYKDIRIKELENWIKDLENGKGWLEEQVRYKDERIKELESIYT